MNDSDFIEFAAIFKEFIAVEFRNGNISENQAMTFLDKIDTITKKVNKIIV